MEPAAHRVLMGLQFFPRGGSAHAAWNLARELPAAGWEPTVLTGSVGLPGRLGNAQTFYEGVRVRVVDMTAALSALDPMRADPPLHPSYEDRPGAPDRVFCSLPDAVFEHHAASWAAALAGAGAASADVVHLHHLTALNEAAARVAPGVPVVGHLHGTELLMLEAATEDPGHWPHSAAWVERLRRWATACERLLVLSATQAERARALLGIDPGRCVHIPNGVDPQLFVPRDVERAPFWRRQLVEAPQGWAPGGEPGSVAYTDAEMAPFERGAPVLLYIGRFTNVKRVPLLIEAHARARDAYATPAPLVIVGGFPGEWEDEHPLTTIRRTGAPDVFLAGWHDHHELPWLLAAGDAVVLPSVREQFGQVLVEGMACGLPAIAIDAHGPAEIIRDGETGWLVEGDDLDSLAAALVDAVNHPHERRRRGQAAAHDTRQRFGWPALARRVAAVYDQVAAGRTAEMPRNPPVRSSTLAAATLRPSRDARQTQANARCAAATRPKPTNGR